MYAAPENLRMSRTCTTKGASPAMPAYDFRCTDCDTVFEVNRPMTASGGECCPDCGAVATKVFAATGISFKGSGFHNTDYRTRPKEETGSCPTASDTPACAGCPAAAAAATE